MADTSALLGYHFVARGPELRIEHQFVEPVIVRLAPFAFTIEPPSPERSDLLPDAEPRVPVSFELCDVGEAAEHVRRAIGARCCRRVPLPPLPIVRGHLLAARSRGLRKINPDAHSVQRAILAVSTSVPRLAFNPVFFDEPFVARDVAQYRSAAIALAHLDGCLLPFWCRQRGLPLQEGNALRLAAMREWRGLFSPTSHPYRSLNRTLMNLPPDVPADLVPHLRAFDLERPLTDGIVLMAVLLHVSDARAARQPERVNPQRRILERASAEEIRRAVASIGHFTDRTLDAERVQDLGFSVRFLIDYPEPFHGSLDGLVRRTIRWHEDQRSPRHGRARPVPARRREAHVDDAPATGPAPPVRLGVRAVRPTARPPIALPTMPGIEFLGSVDRIRAEARRMDNCIASYAQSAVDGDCYLFHVIYEGLHASVEVDPLGRVRQAEGPGNTHNAAAAWGAERLAEWGRQLRDPTPRDTPDGTLRATDEI